MLSFSVVVMDNAPPTASPPLLTMHHPQDDMTLRLMSREEHIFRLLVNAAKATMLDC